MNDLTRSRCEYLLRNNRLVNDWNTVVEQLLLQNQPKTVKKKRKKKNNQEKVKSQHILLLEQKLNGAYDKYLSSGSLSGALSRAAMFCHYKISTLTMTVNFESKSSTKTVHLNPIGHFHPKTAILRQIFFSEDQEHRKRLLEDHAHLESTVTNINTELENEKEKTRKTLKLAYLLRLEIAKVGFRKLSFFRDCILRLIYFRWSDNSARDRKSSIIFLNFQASKIEPILLKTHLSKKL